VLPLDASQVTTNVNGKTYGASLRLLASGNSISRRDSLKLAAAGLTAATTANILASAAVGQAAAPLDAASRISRSRFVCTSCGSIFDADVNAAKNILRLGISPTGGLPGMACESSRTTGRKQEEDARNGGSSVLQGRE
jgi:hypothetical protein